MTMIYPSDLSNLITQWTERVHQGDHNSDYIIAVQECLLDLQELIDKHIEEELTYEDFLRMEADNYLSTIEAHEIAA